VDTSYCFGFSCFWALFIISVGVDLFVTDGPTLTCHDDGQLSFPCAALIILELDVSSWLHVMRTSQINFEVVDAIQKHNAIFQDHFHVLTKGAHAMIMAVKHISPKPVPLPPYQYTTSKEQASKKYGHHHQSAHSVDAHGLQSSHQCSKTFDIGQTSQVVPSEAAFHRIL
jgi:hypothetical protein